MSKRAKEHRKKVAARNQKIIHARKQQHDIPGVNFNPYKAIIMDSSLSIDSRLAVLKAFVKMKLRNSSKTKDTIIKASSPMETKKEETKDAKQIKMGPGAPAAQQGGEEPVYKFTKPAYEALGAYLLTRPIKEVQVLYKAFFKHGLEDPFYKEGPINSLIEYLMNCPMGEVEPIVDMLQGGGLQQFVPAPVPAEGSEKKEESPAPAETAK